LHNEHPQNKFLKLTVHISIEIFTQENLACFPGTLFAVYFAVICNMMKLK